MSKEPSEHETEDKNVHWGVGDSFQEIVILRLVLKNERKPSKDVLKGILNYGDSLATY